MKKNVLSIALLLACLFFTTFCLAQQIVGVKDSTLSFRSVGSPATLILTPSDSLFFPAKERTFNFGLTIHEYCYILLKIEFSKPGRSYSLSIDNTSLDTVLIYRLHPSRLRTLVYKGGNLIPYLAERPYVWHTLRLIQSPGEPAFYLIAAKAAAKNVNITYKLLEDTRLQKLYISFDRLIGSYLGFISLILFICGIGIILFRNKVIALYMAYILSMTAWLLAHYGYLYPALYPWYPPLNNIVKAVCCLTAANSFLTLVQTVFSQDLRTTSFSFLYNVLKQTNQVFLCLSAASLLLPFSAVAALAYNIGWNASLLLSISVIVGTLLWLYPKSRTAKIFLGAVGTLSLMALLQLLALLGNLQSAFLNDHGILIGSCLEMLVLVIGVFYNIWEDKTSTGKRLEVVERKQKDALRMLIQAQESERKRIAEDLHDSIGPMLAAIRINFLRIIRARSGQADVESLILKTESIIDDSISEIRDISHQLMPKNLISKGLIRLLSEYFENLQNVFGLTLRFTHNINGFMDEELQLNIYRVVCELVLNAAKHGRATAIEVSLNVLHTGLESVIRDNGQGFEPAARPGDSYGLKNVESRISYHKGTLTIQSSPAQGTHIRISIPSP